MANPTIALMGKAKVLGIAGYRTMSQEELREAVANAEGKSTAPKKGVAKVSANGTKGKATATKAVKGVAKTATKGVAKKSAPAKSTKPATKAASGKAKRQSTKAVKGAWVPGSPGRRPANLKPAQLKEHERIIAERKANRPRNYDTVWVPGSRGRRPDDVTDKQLAEHAKLIAQAKAERAGRSVELNAERRANLMKKGARKLTPSQLEKQGGYRVPIDHSEVDWKLDTRIGGREGKRQDVMKALRRFNGNIDKVVDFLSDNIDAWFSNYPKAERPRMLRWIVNRVAYDYVMDTDQHVKGQRAAYGTSQNPIALRRRQENAKAGRKPGRPATAPKATGAAKKAAPAKGRVKATRKRSTPQKGSQRRTAASRKGVATKGRARR